MVKTIIAIDPGASGGFCQFIGTRAIHAWKFTSLSDFVDDLFEIKADPDLTLELVLEDVPPFAGKNIPSSTGFKLGKSCGFYEGVARGLRIPCHMVRPQTWQKGFGGVKGQSTSVKKRILKDHASRLYPQLGKQITLATADAVLIGHFHTTTTKQKI